MSSVKFAEVLWRPAMRHRLSSSNGDGVEVELQHGPPGREFRSCCMMRWIFRLIVMTVAAKLVNRYLGERHPQPRSQR
jgi:hypothetical protein